MFNIRKRRMAAGRSGPHRERGPRAHGLRRRRRAASEAAATYDPDEEVTLNLAFWGNDVRAALYDEAIAAFNEEYPNITVNSSFLGFPEFWEKRQTEAAGGGLPDVMQFDYSYLRQYSENGLLLDLEPYLGNIIDTEPLSENILGDRRRRRRDHRHPDLHQRVGPVHEPEAARPGRRRGVRGRQLGGLRPPGSKRSPRRRSRRDSGAAPTTPAASRTSRSSSAPRVTTSSPRTASRTSPRRTSPRSGSRARTSAPAHDPAAAPRGDLPGLGLRRRRSPRAS